LKPRVAVEENLTPIEEFLSERGYEVENINFTDAEEISSLVDELTLSLYQVWIQTCLELKILKQMQLS